MHERMARSLYERRTHFFHLEYVKSCPADWAPAPNRCHENVAAWVERFPLWTVVRGWLLISQHDALGAMFDAHSVVRDEEGHLWDVTQNDVHQFLIHPGDEDEFMKQVEAGPWVRLHYIPGL